jgi:hypothetical protein
MNNNNNNNQHKNLVTTGRILHFINNTPFNGCHFSVDFLLDAKSLFALCLSSQEKYSV